MRRLTPDQESKIPRISKNHFTQEKNARRLEIDAVELMGMLQLERRWKLIGWTLAEEVAPRNGCLYVILCRRDDLIAWCHINHVSLGSIIEKTRLDPSKLTSLR